MNLNASEPKVHKTPVKEPKRTWQPNSNWRASLPKISRDSIVQELEDILDEPFKILSIDFLPFLAHDCRHLYPDFQELLNAIAKTAYLCDLIGENGEPGESTMNQASWKYLQERWGDLGVLIVLAYDCGLDDFLVVDQTGLSLSIDSIVKKHESIESLLPLKALLTYNNQGTKRGNWLEISTYEGGEEYWVTPNWLDSFAQFPDWESALLKENLIKLIPIFTFQLKVDLTTDVDLNTTRASYHSHLRFELPKSSEPPLRVFSRNVTVNHHAGLNPESILAMHQVFQASKIRHRSIKNEILE